MFNKMKKKKEIKTMEDNNYNYSSETVAADEVETVEEVAAAEPEKVETPKAKKEPKINFEASAIGEKALKGEITREEMETLLKEVFADKEEKYITDNKDTLKSFYKNKDINIDTLLDSVNKASGLDFTKTKLSKLIKKFKI